MSWEMCQTQFDHIWRQFEAGPCSFFFPPSPIFAISAAPRIKLDNRDWRNIKRTTFQLYIGQNLTIFPGKYGVLWVFFRKTSWLNSIMLNISQPFFLVQIMCGIAFQLHRRLLEVFPSFEVRRCPVPCLASSRHTSHFPRAFTQRRQDLSAHVGKLHSTWCDTPSPPPLQDILELKKKIMNNVLILVSFMAVHQSFAPK